MTTDYFKSYDNLGELLDDARKPCRVEANTKHLASDSDTGWMCADRRGIKTFNAAFAALAEPLFPAGVERLERLSAQIEVPAPASIKRKVRRGDHGDEIDMQRVWQGNLDHAWSRAKRERAFGASRVLIGVFVGALANTASEQIAWRGVAGLALADALEKSGYTVCVRAIRRAALSLRNGTKGPKHDLDITIKPESSQLDLHKTASLIASTLLFRGVLLRHAIAHAPVAIDEGVSVTDYERTDDLRDTTGYDHTCVASEDVCDTASAQAWVTKQVNILDARNADAHFN